ncbi:YdiK family protein [Bacillus sp. T3]|uniref:YdiK family protein n=1 Tax=Bacillus sp. T3 TaxID=467262 RepID=UPI00298267BB|nr:YdiK family protein [Bacillus sp. T3]
MRLSPLFSAFFHIILACIFTYFAIDNVNQFGWDIFSFILVLLATFDFGSGLRLIALHFKLRKIIKKNEP